RNVSTYVPVGPLQSSPFMADVGGAGTSLHALAAGKRATSSNATRFRGISTFAAIDIPQFSRSESERSPVGKSHADRALGWIEGDVGSLVSAVEDGVRRDVGDDAGIELSETGEIVDPMLRHRHGIAELGREMPLLFEELGGAVGLGQGEVHPQEIAP